MSFFRPHIRHHQLSGKKPVYRQEGKYEGTMYLHQEWARKNMSEKGMREYRRKQALRIGFLACALTGSAGLIFNEPIVVRGQPNKSIPESKIDTTTIELSRTMYKGLSYPEKYLTQFIQPKTTRTRSNSIEGGSGILGLISTPGYKKVGIGESCLAGSAYDTQPANIRIEGFSSGGGDIPAPAAINFASGPKTLSVVPQASNAQVLKFTENTKYHHLEPADEATAITLSTAYNCTPGHAAYVEGEQGIIRRLTFPNN